MHLFWIQGPRRQARLRLEGSFFVIGRAEAFPVFQDDVTISREHAVVVETSQGVTLKDLGSRNGVLLNGRKLARYEEVALSPGDELLVGRTTVRWLREGETEPAPPAGGSTQQLTVDREGRSDSRVAPPPLAPTEGGPVEGDDLTRTEDALEDDDPTRTEEALDDGAGLEVLHDPEATLDLQPLEAADEPAGEVTEAMDPPPSPGGEPPAEEGPLLE